MALQKKRITHTSHPVGDTAGKKVILLVGFMIGALPSCIPDSPQEGRPRLKIEGLDNEVMTKPQTAPPQRSDGLFQIKSDYCLCRGGSPFFFSPQEKCLQTCADATGPKIKLPSSSDKSK